MTVRENTPIRRLTPTLNPPIGNWTKHKPDLRHDFNQHCGYCGSYDGFRHTWFEVDHFIPKSFFEQIGNITNVDYLNLVYSCKYCNNNKSNKWPSNSETIYNINNEGFVEVCSTDYDDHLYRTDSGSIMWKTALGKWMATKAFKFDERERSIIVLWNLNELRKIINMLILELENYNVGEKMHIEINNKLGEYSLTYFKFHQELIDYYND
jgi:hypothetical protein